MRRSLAFFALSLLATTLFAIDPPREKERWTTLKIEEFTIYSNANDFVTRKVASDLMQLPDVLSVVTKLKVRSPLPTRVYIFADSRTFNPYCDAVLGRSNHLSGLFLSSRDGNHVLIDGSVSAHGVDHVVYHELTHYFLRNTVPAQVPLWFNEGIAEFYSTVTSHDDIVDVGRPVAEHVAFLRTQPLIPLKDLFAINHDSKDYHEGNRQGVFYAESWALVHYLMIGNPERRTQLGTYVGLIAGGKSIDDAFRAAFHESYDDLERELRKYIRAFSMSYIRYTLADLKGAEVPAPQPLARDALLVGLADLLMQAQTPHFGEVETFLSEALKVNPSSADASAEMGVAKSRQRQNDEAETYFEKAVQLGSTNYLPYLLYADSILRRVDATLRRNAGAPSADVAKARELFRKAAELNPSSAIAFAGLGATYTMTKDDPAPGIAALDRSLALAPSEVDALYNMVVLDARAGRREDAERRLAVLASVTDAETVGKARESLNFADVNRASELDAAGKHAEALEIFKRVATETTNDRLKAYLAQRLAPVDHVDAANGHVDVVNGQIADFQRAVKTANAGKFQEALAMVDDLMPKITDPEMMAAAKDLRAKLKEYIAATTPKKKK
jgi:tetratricopeptide (TPR) repeat protein